MALAKIIKISDGSTQKRDSIEVSSEMRELLMTERQALLIRLSSLEKFLGLSRKCKSCGEVL